MVEVRNTIAEKYNTSAESGMYEEGLAGSYEMKNRPVKIRVPTKVSEEGELVDPEELKVLEKGKKDRIDKCRKYAITVGRKGNMHA